MRHNKINDKTLRQLDALNNWLGDVYGEEIRFSTLLTDAGCTEMEIEQIKREHLNEFMQAVLEFMAEYADDRSSEGRNQLTMELMVRNYGLVDGEPENRYAIGHNVGVCGERIRQLVSRRLNVYRDPKQQTRFQDNFVAIGRKLLDDVEHSLPDEDG